jgi:hypothetical protein
MIIHAEITGITLLLVIGLIMGIIALKRKKKWSSPKSSVKLFKRPQFLCPQLLFL